MGRDKGSGNGGEQHDRSAEQDKQAAKDHYKKQADELEQEQQGDQNGE